MGTSKITSLLLCGALVGCATEPAATPTDSGRPDDDAGAAASDAGRARGDAGRRDAGWDAGPAPTDAGPSCRAYADGDGDGYGDPGAPVDYPCGEMPADTVENDEDCNDDDPTARPGFEGTRTEPMPDGSWDWDCDGVITRRSERWADCAAPTVGEEGWLRLCIEASGGECLVWERDSIPDCGELAELTRDGRCSGRAMQYQSCR